MDSLATRFEKDVFATYTDLLKAQFRIHPTFSFVREIWDRDLSMERLANGPFLERAQLYAQGEDVHSLGLQPDALRAIEVAPTWMFSLMARGLRWHPWPTVHRCG